MHEANEDDMERLANRLALLVSETGEADNAGRAVGTLARRLGLSGGELKEIFLAGAAGGARARRDPPRRGDGDTARLEREVSSLRHSLTLAEVTARNAEAERDILQSQIETMQSAQLAADATAGRRRGLAALAVVLGVIAAGSIVLLQNRLHALTATPGALEADAAASIAVPRPAKVRGTGTALFPMPERTGAVITTLPSGTKIVVVRLFWRSLMQWAEVDAAGRHGYVVTTEIDIS